MTGISPRQVWGFNTSFGMLVPPAPAQPVPTTGMGRVQFNGDGTAR